MDITNAERIESREIPCQDHRLNPDQAMIDTRCVVDLSDEQLLRYGRQILLPDFGIEGQERLAAARVLIVGLGGLGSPVAMYLAAAGVGRIHLADFDRIDLSNLQRQILHDTDHIGWTKTASACQRLARLNPEVEIIAIQSRLSTESLRVVVAQVDLVVDCCDNFATRLAINGACFAAGVPLVSGAAIRMEGQITAFSGSSGGPCYRCLHPSEVHEDRTCSANGVLAPLVGIIGSIQATEAIKILTGLGTPLYGRLLLLDAATMDWRSLSLNADPECPVCSREASGSSGTSL